jgi:hypothetical protein
MSYGTTVRLPLLFGLLLFIFAAGCSKEDDENNPVTSPATDGFLWIHLSNDSTKIPFAGLPKIDADGMEAIVLSKFVDTTLVPKFKDKGGTLHDARVLYGYEIVADDGYSPSSVKGYPDNIWEHLTLGHILTATRRVVFPYDQIDLPSAYNVKEARSIFLHRKFDIETPDTAVFIELKDIAAVQVKNPDSVLEDAIPLKDFVLLLVSNPDDYSYNIVSLDNFGPETDMTWTQFQTGYWLLTSQKTMFTNTALVGGRYKLKMLNRILVNQ